MKLTQDYNLTIINPKLAKEWHPIRNGDLSPNDVTPNSGKKVWWKCQKGHDWEAIVGKRNKGNGCPFCAGRKVNEDICLLAINPDLAKEWHPIRNGDLSPNDITPNSGKKVWWKCQKGHDWEAIVSDRNRGRGCPYCSGRRATENNCLLNQNPELAKEWHPTKNGNLTSSDVTPNSGKKVWWKCQKGHDWEAIVGDRNSGNGCPFCAGQRATEENNLQKINPELAKEWHPTKNGELTPRDVMPGSNKKVWWVCNKKHEWTAVIGSRTIGRGCPCCSGRQPTEYNCLLKLKPDLAKEWHPTKNGKLEPKDVTVSSSKKVWWFCEKDHEWEDTIAHRSSGRGCPYCSGRKLSEETCLLSVYPELAQEWHPTKNGDLKPINCHAGSNKKVWWACSKGHEWQDHVNRRIRTPGCPYCYGRRLAEDNCLLKLNPELAKDWHPTKNGKKSPKDVMPSSCKKVWWQCKKGHEWQATPGNRSRGANCPHCNSKTSMIELQIYSELKYIFPGTRLRKKVKGKEIDIYIPSLHFGIEIDGEYWHRKKYLKDKKKSQFFNKNGIHLLRLREKGLELITDSDIVYSKRSKLFSLIKKILLVLLKQNKLIEIKKSQIKKYILAGKIANNSEFINLWDMLPGPILADSLYTKKRELGKEWHPTKNGRLTTKDVSAYSNKKAWWLCREEHEWQAVIGSRFSGVGCPYCSGKKATEENCLSYAYPEIAEEWHPTKNGKLNPVNVTPGSAKKIWWLCQKGHEWEASVKRRKWGEGCPFCSGRRPSKEYCLKKVNPELAKEWHPTKNGNLTSSDVTPNSGKKVWWKCQKGHDWETTVDGRNRGRGCPYCSGRRATENNCLLNQNPELAKEWHSTRNGKCSPKDITPFSGKKVWWQCARGHEWQATVGNRNKGKTRCHLCRKLNSKNQYKKLVYKKNVTNPAQLKFTF